MELHINGFSTGNPPLQISVRIMQKFLPSLLTYRSARQCQAMDEQQNVVKTSR